MKIDVVLLAAGNSVRFGGNKLLFKYHGKPMVQYAAEMIQKLDTRLVHSRIVVTQYQELADSLQQQGFQVVRNLESDLGISRSVALGVEAAKDADAICFCVCDQPNLQADTVNAFLHAWKSSGKGIGQLACHGCAGNPTIFAATYAAELMACKGDVGGRQVLRRHPEDCFVFEIPDASELCDIDVRPSDASDPDRTQDS